MASPRMRGRGDKVRHVLSSAVSNYGMSPWTVPELKRKNVEIHHGIVPFMHGEGLIKKMVERRGYVSSWAVTAKGMSVVRRG